MNSLHLFQSHTISRQNGRFSLYFKKMGGETPVHLILNNDNTLKLYYRDVISFDTYFNTFFENYVTTHTVLEKIILSVKVKGRGCLEIFRFIEGKSFQTLSINLFNTNGEITELRHEIILEKDHQLGSRISFHLTGDRGGCVYYGGGWFTEQTPVRHVILNAVICTFKKLRYLDKTVDCLLKFKHLDTCDWKLLIVDNASEIEKTRYKSEKVQIFPQENSGGAGGFTRGIIESIYEKKKKSRDVSYILLMDDDIELNAECVFHTIRFLEYLRKDSCIGGGMIDLNKPTIMHEHGADLGSTGNFWDVTSKFKNLNLADSATLSFLSRAQSPATYNAWWFFAFPLSACEKVGLPMPCFIRGDDQEFGIRLKKNNFNLMTPPGIALWHEPFEAKQAGWGSYFGVYNNLVISATLNENLDLKKILYALKNGLILPLLQKKNYAWALAVIGAIEDFIKGPKFFMESTPAERMQRARSFDIQYGPEEIVEIPRNLPRASPIRSYVIREFWRRLDHGNRYFKLLKFFGIIKNSAVVNERDWLWHHSAMNDSLYVSSDYTTKIKVYKTNRVLYRQGKKLMNEMLEKLEREFLGLSRDFKNAQKTYTQFPFWEQYLKIKKE
jgi:galactofuranosylgalactofuranosylrhamnosyl-N-acetylglucosaminyl-diphospho-decaprenol beta-1,5/1,6-galactofuranosyltransferase